MKIIFVLIFLSVSSLIDAKHHHHHCHQYFDCDLGQIWDQESCSCKCISDESSCKNREIFDDYFCTCFCPYSRHHKCSDKNKQWSYINCDCVCKDEKARKACTNGRWSKSQCKCIPNTTTTSTTVKLTTTQQINTTQSVTESSTTQPATKISTIQTITDTTATQKVTNQQTTPVSITTIQPVTVISTISGQSTTTQIVTNTTATPQITASSTIQPVTVISTTPSQSTTFVTTKAPTCSYGVKTYNGETSINGIISGYGVDGNPIYAGFTTVNGINIPGGLQTSNSLAYGLCYGYRNQSDCFVTKNVSFIVNTPDCNCYFINKDDPIPNNGYLVTFNDGANLLGVGVFSLSNPLFNMSMTGTGTIDVNSNTLYYFDTFDLAVLTTTNFTKLICAPPTSTVTTAQPVATTTTAFQVTNPSTQFAALAAQSSAIQTGLSTIDSSLSTLFGQFSSGIQAAISNPLTDAATVTTLQQLAAILDQDPSTYTTPSPARRKRQTIECAADTLIEQNLDTYLKNRQPRMLYYNTLNYRLFKVYQSNPAMKYPSAFIGFYVSFNGLSKQLNDNTNNLNTILSQMKILLPYICNPPTAIPTLPPVTIPPVTVPLLTTPAIPQVPTVPAVPGFP
ncbi:hypothetical protein PVAND_006308 [Polypedilum vanderplanki]|uniref:Uncharacterized protein n=1 Tax=Polypedilum vanderplanki TaxID=319348 RepID=A0A9J6C3K3_POLVA|nr:hypothetical protein PVAND_006308 [Polypedilum vanderplanki]